jgi:hypothetical protein
LDSNTEKFLKDLVKIYAGEGDDTPLMPEGMIRDMMVNRSRLAKSFPTVSSDLDKMKKTFDEVKETNTTYNNTKREIRAKLRELKVDH